VAYQLNVSETRPTKVVSTIAVTDIRLRRFDVNRGEPGDPSDRTITLIYVAGYRDGGNNFIPVDRVRKEVRATPKVNSLFNAVTAGGGLWDEIEAAVFSFLQSEGDIASGTNVPD